MTAEITKKMCKMPCYEKGQNDCLPVPASECDVSPINESIIGTDDGDGSLLVSVPNL